MGGVLGKALRCSPQKKESGKRMTIPSDDLGARRGLNFSGDQRRRATSAASSSAGQRNRDDQVHKRRRYREEEREAGDATFGAHMGIPIEISEELVAGVKKMGMDHVLPDLNQQPLPASPERVSGMNRSSSLCHEAAGWEPPPAGWIKFNVDESHVPQSGEAGVGWWLETVEIKLRQCWGYARMPQKRKPRHA